MLRAEDAHPFAEGPDTACGPVGHALAAAWSSAVRPPASIDEVDELAIALLHRHDERQQSERLVSRTLLASHLESPEVHDCRTRGIIQAGDSLRTVTFGGGSRAIVRCFGVQGHDSDRAPVHDGVESEVLQMIERQREQWRRRGRRRGPGAPPACQDERAEENEPQRDGQTHSGTAPSCLSIARASEAISSFLSTRAAATETSAAP